MEVAYKEEKEEGINIGRKAQRVREVTGMKQYTLADLCGWSQQKMSKLENSEFIDDKDLETIAKNLGVTPEFIKNFKEEKAVYNIMNAYDSSENSVNYQPVINVGSVENLSELLEKHIRDELQKSQTLTELGKVVLELVKEVKELKEKK